MKPTKYTKIELRLFNYGLHSVAKFNSFHDAMQCMKSFNDTLLLSHKVLPENIFYFLQFNRDGKRSYHVDYTGAELEDMDKRFFKVKEVTETK